MGRGTACVQHGRAGAEHVSVRRDGGSCQSWPGGGPQGAWRHSGAKQKPWFTALPRRCHAHLSLKKKGRKEGKKGGRKICIRAAGGGGQMQNDPRSWSFQEDSVPALQGEGEIQASRLDL